MDVERSADRETLEGGASNLLANVCGQCSRTPRVGIIFTFIHRALARSPRLPCGARRIHAVPKGSATVGPATQHFYKIT